MFLIKSMPFPLFLLGNIYFGVILMHVIYLIFSKHEKGKVSQLV